MKTLIASLIIASTALLMSSAVKADTNYKCFDNHNVVQHIMITNDGTFFDDNNKLMAKFVQRTNNVDMYEGTGFQGESIQYYMGTDGTMKITDSLNTPISVYMCHVA